jgi:hypothetical protein
VTMQSTLPQPTAAALAEIALRTIGYQPGVPPSYAPMAAAIDRATARKMRCPSCGKAGMGCKHYHRGESVRCIAVCRSCPGVSEEV